MAAHWADLGTQFGPFASLPTPGVSGRSYYCSDAPLVMVDNGSAWNTYQVGSVPLVKPPAAATFTAVNEAGAATTVADSFGGIVLSCTNASATNVPDYRLIKKATPGAAYTCLLHFIPTLNYKYPGAGMCLRDSATGNIIAFGVTNNSDSNFAQHSLWLELGTASNNSASPSFTRSTIYSTQLDIIAISTGGLWLKMVNDGTTNRTYSISNDGINFVQVLQHARTTGITENEVGMYLMGNAVAGATQNPFAAVWFNSYQAA